MVNRSLSPVVSSQYRGAFVIAVLYLAIGSLWILFSDQLAAKIAPNQAALTEISLYKGWGYVLVTAILLYWLIRRDSIQRTLGEEKLLENENRFRSLFENMLNGFAYCKMIFDQGHPQDFIYLDVNRAFETLTGLKDVVGKKVSEVIPGLRESDPELVEIYGSVSLTGIPRTFETYMEALSMWFSISVYSPRKEYFVTVFDVITERKHAEEKLRENEERLRLSLQAANQGLYDLNVKTGNTVVNPEYARMLGYDPDTFVETNSAWIERLHPEDKEITAKAYADYINGLIPEYRVEFRQRTKKGDWKWILSLGRIAEYDSNGKPLRMLGTHTDITQRKQAEEALKQAHDQLELRVQQRTAELSEANSLLQTLMDYMPDQIYFKDAESRFIRNSRSQANALGLSDPSQAVGKTDFDFFPHAQRSYDEEQEIIRSGKLQVDFEEWVVWPDGKGTWVSTTKVPLRNQEGKIIGTFGISRDITDRKRAEESLRKAKDELENKVTERTLELREVNKQLRLELTERKQAKEALQRSEQRLNGIIASAMDAIISVDSGQIVVLFNAAAENMFGCSASEAVGQPLERFIPERFRAAHREHIHTFGETGVTNRAMNALGVILGQRASGEEFPIEASISQIKIDAKKLYTVILRDITERKRAEEKLRESEEKWRRLFTILPVGVSILDAHLAISELNPALERILEITSEPALTGAYKQRKYLRSDNTLMESKEFPSMRAVQEQRIIEHIEVGVVKEDGVTSWTEVSAAPMPFPDATCVIVTTDITDRKRTEEELKRSNTELEQFAYIASHDLQEPLRAVAGMVQLLGQRYRGKLDSRADEYISLAVEASDRMQKLINDLLAYSRVDRHGKPFGLTNVEAALITALANLQVAIEESHAEVTHDALPTVFADQTQLTQVFQNLIGNAIKFRGERPLQIHIGAQELDDAWRFEVRDNGIGIEPQYFERIFLVFQRLHTRREYPGTGIGLSLCKKIVERHGGRIWVESEAGRGSAFYFTIPNRR